MPRKKFAFIGAGSFGFTRGLAKDLLTFEAFKDAELCLMDISQERLEFARQAVQKIVEEGRYPAKVTWTMDRAEALKGADGVLCTILSGGIDIWRNDIEIPKKYGVDINVGDTRGPSGIFRFLRTAPVMLGIARDIEKYCPDAVFLNYTNPMAMLCRILQGETSVNVTGLCHSVQGTAEMLARWVGAPMDEVSYFCAGINHQAHYLKFEWNGKSIYPALKKLILENKDIYNEEQVRNEMYLALGYYITESTGHNSEYVAWFRKRPDLIEKYCTHSTGWNPGEYAYILNEYLKREDTWKNEFKDWMAKPADLARGHEYAAYIFNAMFGDHTPFEFNGNVRNNGIIDNLPQGCCVEVPVLASRRGIDPFKVGNLPPQLAILNNVSARIEEMAVEGSLAGDREMIYQAICFDPLTSAVLSLKEIKSMVDEMFEASKDYLPQFKKK
jgi:alpha-galactosidase